MKVLVAVPVFNEEGYVQRVLAEIRRYAQDVLVVNDGSTDRTGEILEAMARRGDIALLTHPENRGYGQSLIDAFKYASERGYDWIITMDCDEQHEPSRIPAFMAACRENNEGGVDIISGSRYMPGSGEDGQPPADRRSINRVMTDLLNSILGWELTDSFCGFKAHRVKALEKLALTIPGYAFPMQFWVQVRYAGLKVAELPVRLIYKDATRHFGGLLDDPTARLGHYMEVLTQELAAVRSWGREEEGACAACCGCEEG